MDQGSALHVIHRKTMQKTKKKPSKRAIGFCIIFRSIFPPKTTPKSSRKPSKNASQEHMKNGHRFSSTFERSWDDFGSQKAANPPRKRDPKLNQKTYIMGKPIPAKEREARYLSLQSSQKFNRGCRNPSLDAQILARMPESSTDAQILARIPKS